jgi:hypothetical protein
MWWITSTRAYSVNPEPNLAKARHNATMPGVKLRLVSLAPKAMPTSLFLYTYGMVVLMRDIGAVQLMLMHN